jgi:mRNA interferase RelE/StbE
MTYQVILNKKAIKGLQKLNKYDKASVEKILIALSINPFPRNARKIQTKDWYRVRVGDYRVIYEVIDQELIIYVINIVNRGDAYKNI